MTVILKQHQRSVSVAMALHCKCCLAHALCKLIMTPCFKSLKTKKAYMVEVVAEVPVLDNTSFGCTRLSSDNPCCMDTLVPRRSGTL